MRRVLISGCGDLGQRVAERWLARGAVVYGLRRSPPEGGPILWTKTDLDRDEGKAPWPAADLVYHFAPPPLDGTRDPRFGRFLKRLGQPPERLVLVSTTGVYGDRGGDWVDEETPPAPTTDRARRRLDAERQLRRAAEPEGFEWVVLRVAGIYGPGRWPLQRLRDGMAVLRAEDAPFTNRIHVDDLAAACVVAGECADTHGVYNVSDGHPGTLTRYFQEIARAFELPSPRELSWNEAREQLSAGMLSYLSESRRIRNDRFLRDTGFELRYPHLEDALEEERR